MTGKKKLTDAELRGARSIVREHLSEPLALEVLASTTSTPLANVLSRVPEIIDELLERRGVVP